MLKLFSIPNILTMFNLLSGSMAVFHALNGRLEYAAYFIIIAGVIDFFDGFAARIFNQASPIGKELDSLADVISFGFAPSCFYFYWLGGTEETAFLPLQFLGFIPAAFAALRLAKFNIDTEQEFDFIGMPTPAMAFYTAGLAFWYVSGNDTSTHLFSNLSIGIHIVLLSFLMLSPFKMMALKFKSYALADNIDKLIFAAVALIILIIFRTLSLPVIIIWYVVFSIAKPIFFTRHK